MSDVIPRITEPVFREPVVRFQEPEADTMSEDGRSVANSETSETTAGGGRRRRRSARSSTVFHLAHPAPTFLQKKKLLEIRPKLLLQLQKLSADSRPKPVLDVLPSTVFAPRLVKKFPRMLKGKKELGCNDVIVVKSEEYDAVEEIKAEGSESDEEGLSNRDLIAVICQVRKDSGGSYGKAEIVLSDGTVFTATPLPNGLYEFVSIDERGEKTTARWVRRTSKPKNIDSSDQASVQPDLKFTFSIIDPTTRRHPILACLTESKLDIPDYFTSVSSSAGRHPPTSPRPFPGEPDLHIADDEPPQQRTTHAVDDYMKILIQITGVWVALRQGWSPYFKYNDSMTSNGATAQQTTPSGRVRSVSLTPDTSKPSPIPTGTTTPESCSSTFLNMGIRRSSVKASSANGDSPQQDRSNLPKRAASAGTAFMQRAAARRAGNPPSTVASDSDGENFGHPTRALTENINGSVLNRYSSPPGALTLGSAASTPDSTPTKPQRRVQSAYIPRSTLQNGFTHEQPDGNGVPPRDGNSSPDSTLKKPFKSGRWKSFTNFFRRGSNRSRNT